MKPIYLLLLTITVLISCNSDGSGGEKDYVDKTDKKLCDCYRERHDRIDIDYDKELDKDFKFWSSKFEQLERMDLKSLEKLFSAFKNGKINLGEDSTEIMEYESNINYRFLRECIEFDSYVNQDSKRFMELTEGGGGTDYPTDKSLKSFKIRIDEHKKVLRELNDGQWLNATYLNVVGYIYKDYKEVIDFEKRAKIEAQKEDEKQRFIEEQEEWLRNNPPPPPPMAIPPPPMEEIIIEENVEEEPPF